MPVLLLQSSNSTKCMGFCRVVPVFLRADKSPLIIECVCCAAIGLSRPLRILLMPQPPFVVFPLWRRPSPPRPLTAQSVRPGRANGRRPVLSAAVAPGGSSTGVVCLSVCVFLSVCARLSVCLCVCWLAGMCVSVCLCVRTGLCVRVNLCMYVSMILCLSVYTCCFVCC